MKLKPLLWYSINTDPNIQNTYLRNQPLVYKGFEVYSAGPWILDALCDNVLGKNKEEWPEGACLMSTDTDTKQFLVYLPHFGL